MPGKTFYAIGLMSGTSLDGLDIAWCRFDLIKNRWSFKILEASTLPYSTTWRSKLLEAPHLTASALLALHADYGHWLGTVCKQFIKKHKIKKLDCIASHGHTIFHQPDKSFTFQLGDGNAIYAETNVPVVSDFRSLDVQLGGQGAPLVPVGDSLLFDAYTICLNIGGIANLSMEKRGKRIAYDICFANMGLNYLANKLNLPFDANGTLAASGQLNEFLLQKLNSFYEPFKANRPSLAREHFESGLSALLNHDSVPLADRLHTFTECIAQQIGLAIPSKSKQKVLVTGGGARNGFLISRLTHHLQKKGTVEIPNHQIIDFKEALVFAFLGVLRKQNKINVLRSVTGASRDSSSGILTGF